MSQEIVQNAIKKELKPQRKSNLRQQCDCLMGNDIGVYNTCGHLCKYCYANANKKLVIDNMKKHDENSPFLIGNLQLGDTIKEAKQKSWIINEDIQMRFTLK